MRRDSFANWSNIWAGQGIWNGRSPDVEPREW